MASLGRKNNYLDRLEKLYTNHMLKQAFIVDCSLPARLSWRPTHAQHGQLHGHLVPPSADTATQCSVFSLSVVQTQDVGQLSQEKSSKASMYRSIGCACESYIQQISNRHPRWVLAQFCTGSHWLNIETGRHRKQDRKDRTCPMCTHWLIHPCLSPEE